MARINAGYYTQLIQFMLNHGHVIENYQKQEELSNYEVANILDEIRRLNEKYFTECEIISIEPRYEKERAIMIHDELIRVCKKFNIGVNFNKNKTEAWKKKVYSQFYIEGNEITDLISFHIKKKGNDLSLTDNNFDL